jgi:DNA-directed RNA polymerase specialized sigma24 family protein
LEFEKLNIAFDLYRSSPSQDNFSRLYNAAKDLFFLPNRGKMIAMGYPNTSDADEIFDDVVLKVTQKENILDIGPMLRTSLRNARINFVDSERRRRGKIGVYLDEEFSDGECAPKLKPPEVESAEKELLFNEEKKRADQRQLVNSLLESSKIHLDPMMIAVIERVKSGETPNAIATAYGLGRNTIDRKLRNISRNFDRNRSGCITDYIPEGLRMKREFISA